MGGCAGWWKCFGQFLFFAFKINGDTMFCRSFCLVCMYQRLSLLKFGATEFLLPSLFDLEVPYWHFALEEFDWPKALKGQRRG